MKRLIFSVLLFFVSFLASANTMSEVFIKMPDHIIVQLEEAWRKDLVDLYVSEKTAVLDNTMGGRSTLQRLTDNYLLLQLTEANTIELKLLPLVNNTYIICMVTTVYGPVADSRVSFYTTEWNVLPAKKMYSPVAHDWFWKENADSSSIAYYDAEMLLDMDLIKYSLSAEEETLTAEYMTPLYVDEENRKKVLSLLKTEPKVYQWNLGRFE